MAEELVHDMEVATKYPPVVDHLLPLPDIVKMINILTESFMGMKDSNAGSGSGSGNDDFSSLLDDL